MGNAYEEISMKMPSSSYNRKKFISTFLFILLVILLSTSRAYANVPLGYYMVASNPAGYLSVYSFGIAAVGIVLIEAIALKIILHIPLRKSFLWSVLLNFISTIVGTAFSPCSTSSSCGVLFTVGILFAASISNGFRKHTPIWFYIIVFPLILVGMIEAGYLSLFNAVENPWFLLLICDLSLLFGFGITLIVEGYTGIFLLKLGREFIKAITYANVCSYIFLSLLFPFFAPNPYSYSYYFSKFSFDKTKPEEAVKIFQLKRSNFQYLLGLTKTNKIKQPYEAYSELYLLRGNLGYKNWEVSKAIADDALTVSSLTSDDESQLKWLSSFYAYIQKADYAVRSSDQDNLNDVYIEFDTWYDNNKGMIKTFKEKYESPDSFLEPWGVIEEILLHYESKLKNPRKILEPKPESQT